MDFDFRVSSTPFTFANPSAGRSALQELLEDVRDVARPLEGLDVDGDGPHCLDFTCTGGRYGVIDAVAALARGLGPHLAGGCRIEIAREDNTEEGGVYFTGPSEEAILRCRRQWALERAREELGAAFAPEDVAAALGRLGCTPGEVDQERDQGREAQPPRRGERGG